jgi:hypothetical protein
MSQLIPEVINNQKIVTAEFVQWTKYSYDTGSSSYQATNYYFSSTYRDETFTVDGNPTTFEHLGGLLQIGVQQRDIKASGFDTSIMLMGVDPDEIYRVVGRETKGSRIRIWRGFYNENYVLTGTPYLRFTGIVTSYNTTEEYQVLEHNNTVSLVLNCSSTKYVLENMFKGRKTNRESWRQYDNTDTSMDGIVSLTTQKFDFGRKV